MKTREIRDTVTRNFAWFVRNRHNSHSINPAAVRAFLVYLRNEDPEGRWGSPRFTAGLKARSVATYDNHLRTFFAWCVKQGSITSNPFDKIEKTVSRDSEIHVFQKSDVDKLLEVATASPAARRNVPLIMFMIDTGLRVSELCAMNVEDVDFDNRKATVRFGKGNKRRTVYFGRMTSRALWNYLLDGRRRGDGHAQTGDTPLFRGYRGRHVGERMTPRGILQIWNESGEAAGVKVRCSPHTARHTCCTWLLRAGMDVTTVKEIMGHEDIRTTEHYAHLNEQDAREQYKTKSPMDNMFK